VIVLLPFACLSRLSVCRSFYTAFSSYSFVYFAYIVFDVWITVIWHSFAVSRFPLLIKAGAFYSFI
jgi:hypothetical protein